ncbi:cysteine-rich CWC family protein [Thermoactinomyces sp. CICC 10523]|nr:cysteine-rich CWC family protein [Thermoactinomyces sp. CICC 10523]MBH8596989.1 cysteine-rich CWC family protein [Thermoactinomyces sp. CICC 10523]
MEENNGQARNCPICGRDNACGYLSRPPQGSCWCTAETFPPEIFGLVPPEQLHQSCICKECLTNFRRKVKPENGMRFLSSGARNL